jgi:hypothetical protein
VQAEDVVKELTVAEALAIVVADDALGFLADTLATSGRTFTGEEREAWEGLVASAHNRIAAYDRSKS